LDRYANEADCLVTLSVIPLKHCGKFGD